MISSSKGHRISYDFVYDIICNIMSLSESFHVAVIIITFYNLTLYPENAILHGTQTVAAKRILYEKNHFKPTFTKTIFGCAEVLRRNYETLGSDASSGRAAPGGGTKPRICASAGRPGRAPLARHRWHTPTRALPHPSHPSPSPSRRLPGLVSTSPRRPGGAGPAGYCLRSPVRYCLRSPVR
jgi:hypothetical protein